ncbi:MAG: DUF456 domain-containing protein [Planctomycetota bacterium]|jgi:uncharacterized protein YqgC (DUF456 family)
MVYLWSTMLVLLNVVWLVLVLFGLPGNWLIVISTCVFAWWRADDGVLSIYTLVAITVLAVLGELIEFLGGASGARKAGASWRGSIGAIIGAIGGAIIGTFTVPVPLFGTVLGACIGAGLGSWGLELTAGRQMKESIRSGIGAGLGELLGITTKFAVGVLIWFIVTVAVFWP